MISVPAFFAPMRDAEFHLSNVLTNHVLHDFAQKGENHGKRNIIKPGRGHVFRNEDEVRHEGALARGVLRPGEGGHGEVEAHEGVRPLLEVQDKRGQ